MRLNDLMWRVFLSDVKSVFIWGEECFYIVDSVEFTSEIYSYVIIDESESSLLDVWIFRAIKKKVHFIFNFGFCALSA